MQDVRVSGVSESSWIVLIVVCFILGGIADTLYEM